MDITKRAGLALALFTLALVALHAGRNRERDGGFDRDEAEWLTLSAAHWAQLTGAGDPWRGLPRPPDADELDPWRSGVHDSTFGFMNPGLPKAVFGATMAAGGHREWDPLLFPRFNRNRPRQAEARAVVQPALAGARGLVLGLSAAIAVLLCAAASRAAGPVAGGVAYALWLASPLIRDASNHVRTDFFPIAFGLAALWVALACGRRRLLAAAGLGVLAGLAVGSKLNGALISLCAGAWICAMWWGARHEERGGVGTLLVRWLVAGVACALVFLACCPWLWVSPAEWPSSLALLFERWEGDIARNQELVAGNREVATTAGQKLALAARGALLRFDPLGELARAPLGVVLVPAGLAALARAARERRRARTVLVYVLVVGVGTALFLPIDWDRFYLPFVPCVILCEACLVGSVVAWARGRFRGDG